VGRVEFCWLMHITKGYANDLWREFDKSVVKYGLMQHGLQSTAQITIG